MKNETAKVLEVHIRLNTKTKMYCACENYIGGAPNTRCCPVCTGMPGSLPVLNKAVIDFAVKAGLATNCEITQLGKMDRKNDFYPDNPKGYQALQCDTPICRNGYVEIETKGMKKNIEINRIELEEGKGKLLQKEGATLIDYNGSGVPFIKIVTETDIKCEEQRNAFLEKLFDILKNIGISDCKAEDVFSGYADSVGKYDYFQDPDLTTIVIDK